MSAQPIDEKRAIHAINLMLVASIKNTLTLDSVGSGKNENLLSDDLEQFVKSHCCCRCCGICPFFASMVSAAC
jgi:hypothetical protein